ncbi:DUF4976 domain-containing protein [Puteibacter caeruleilacunae]|nr:DUF4976 domain-containing protein [Puteibacter caeruleilacunae]
MKPLSIFSTAALAALSVAAKADDRPNILWLVSEDNSPYLGCYGDPIAQTPHLDQLASEGVVFDMAFSNAPVCAPSRSTIISGLYASSLGTENMRSGYNIPKDVKFFPQYLRSAGYYCTNNAKKDYNMPEPKGVWDESSGKAHYKKRKEGQPFFAVFNYAITHESCLHPEKHKPVQTDPATVKLNPHHPDIPEVRSDYAKYYDRMTDLDNIVGKMVQELKDAGEYENTIIFYYSDHGGVLPWSKRFISDAGTKVPMIIRVPEKYKKLSPFNMGSRTSRIVNFVDLGPTVMSLAGIAPAKNMQGLPFMGKYETKPRKLSVNYRARMDERIDLCRGVRNEEFHYIMNYMPWKRYGQFLEYLWKAPSMQAWEAYYKAGKCSPLEGRFFNAKDVEELYDVKNDPYETNNLAKDPKYAKVLKQMRKEHFAFIAETKDAGFIPEGELEEISKQGTAYEKVREAGYPLNEIHKMAFAAAQGDDVALLRKGIAHKNVVVRYWATQGIAHLKDLSAKDISLLEKLLKDPSGSIRLSAAEGLYLNGKKDMAIKAIGKELSSDNSKVVLYACNLIDLIGDDAKSLKKEMNETLKNPADKYISRSLTHWLDAHK